jgi:hypothetical protein
VVTSSKSTFDPYRIDTPFTEIIAAHSCRPCVVGRKRSSLTGSVPDASSPAPPAYLTDGATLEAFIGAWRAGTLPKPEWTHAAHVAVCAGRYSFDLVADVRARTEWVPPDR